MDSAPLHPVPLMFDSEMNSVVLHQRVYESLFDLSESVSQRTSVSVVIPVYNEVSTIEGNQSCFQNRL